MRIVLLRHGKPDLSSTDKITANEMGDWIEQYNSAPLEVNFIPPDQAIEAVKKCRYIVCSDLSRSNDSANILGVKNIDHIAEIFREFELPYTKIFNLRLTPNSWVIFFRLVWFMGISFNSETLSNAKQRSSVCAQKLIEFALTNDSVAFIGHGFMNRFISKHLLSLGWTQTVKATSGFWGFAVFDYK